MNRFSNLLQQTNTLSPKPVAQNRQHLVAANANGSFRSWQTSGPQPTRSMSNHDQNSTEDAMMNQAYMAMTLRVNDTNAQKQAPASLIQKQQHVVRSEAEKQCVGNEEILDEGNLLQSHGVSPPRFSVVSNNNLNQIGHDAAMGSIFSSSRQSEVYKSKTVSKMISPRRDYKSGATQLQFFQSENNLLSSEVLQVYRTNGAGQEGAGGKQKSDHLTLQVKPCEQSFMPATSPTETANVQSAFAGFEKKLQGPDKVTTPQKTTKKQLNKKSFAFSGDLLDVDSPRSNGPANNIGLSNRMASLTNKHKQFIQSNGGGPKRQGQEMSLHEAILYAKNGNEEFRTNKKDGSCGGVSLSSNRQLDDSTNERMPIAMPQTTRHVTTTDFIVDQKEQQNDKTPAMISDREQKPVVLKELLAIANEKDNDQQLQGSSRHKLAGRLSLDFVLGMSPSHLKDYMMNLKGQKQRAFSGNDDQIDILGASLRSEIAQQVHHPIIVENTDQSNLISRRSETSHEVWNAGQSSVHNGLASPAETNSCCFIKSPIYSHAMSPRCDEQTPQRRRGTEYTLGTIKQSIHENIGCQQDRITNPEFVALQPHAIVSQAYSSPTKYESSANQEQNAFKLNLVNITVKPLEVSFNTGSHQISTAKQIDTQGTITKQGSEKSLQTKSKSSDSRKLTQQQTQQQQQIDTAVAKGGNYAKIAYGAPTQSIASKRYSSNPQSTNPYIPTMNTTSNIVMTSVPQIVPPGKSTAAMKPPTGSSPEQRRQLLYRKNSKQTGYNLLTKQKSLNLTKSGQQLAIYTKQSQSSTLLPAQQQSSTTRIKCLRKAPKTMTGLLYEQHQLSQLSQVSLQHPPLTTHNSVVTNNAALVGTGTELSKRSSFSQNSKNSVQKKNQVHHYMTIKHNSCQKKLQQAQLKTPSAIHSNYRTAESTSVNKQVNKSQSVQLFSGAVSQYSNQKTATTKQTTKGNAAMMLCKDQQKNKTTKQQPTMVATKSGKLSARPCFTATKSEQSPNATQKQRRYFYPNNNTLLSSASGGFNKKSQHQYSNGVIKNGGLTSAHSGGKFTAIKYPKFTIQLQQPHVGGLKSKKFNTQKKGREEHSHTLNSSLKGGFATSPIKREKEVQHQSAALAIIKHGDDFNKEAEPVDPSSNAISMFDYQIGGDVLSPPREPNIKKVVGDDSAAKNSNKIPFSLDKDCIDLVLTSARNTPLSVMQHPIENPAKEQLAHNKLESLLDGSQPKKQINFKKSPEFGQLNKSIDLKQPHQDNVEEPVNKSIEITKGLMSKDLTLEPHSLYLSRCPETIELSISPVISPNLQGAFSANCRNSPYQAAEQSNCQVTFSSIKGSQIIQRGDDGQQKAQAASFTTRYGANENLNRHQQLRLFPQNQQLENSIISRNSQPQLLPEFQQIESTDKPEDFIDGFEKFTREVQDFIVVKDEQMHNLIHERKAQFQLKSVTLQLIEESRLANARTPQVFVNQVKAQAPMINNKDKIEVVSRSQILSPRLMHTNSVVNGIKAQNLVKYQHSTSTQSLLMEGNTRGRMFGNLSPRVKPCSTTSKVHNLLAGATSNYGHLNASSNHTFLSADGAQVSFVTAKQTEAEIQEFEEQRKQKMLNQTNHNNVEEIITRMSQEQVVNNEEIKQQAPIKIHKSPTKHHQSMTNLDQLMLDNDIEVDSINQSQSNRSGPISARIIQSNSSQIELTLAQQISSQTIDSTTVLGQIKLGNGIIIENDLIISRYGNKKDDSLIDHSDSTK